MESDHRRRLLDLTGVALATLGAVLISLGWYALQDERTVVEQLPYLASGGIGGLAAVIAGAAVVHLSRQWRLEREVARMAATQEELRGALETLATAVGDDKGGAPLPGGRRTRRAGRLTHLEELAPASNQQG